MSVQKRGGHPLIKTGTLVCTVLLMTLLAACAVSDSNDKQTKAYPGAMGWAADTPGGRGGTILRVTTVAPDGPGSFAEALRTSGPRTVVFEVGGVIDLTGQSIVISEPFLTVAGQTAPAPGITFIRGGLGIQTHDVVIRHIRVRPGEAGNDKESGWEVDGIATSSGAYNVIVDHCSVSWATDENLSASGPRHNGETPDEWRQNTSHTITFSNNIISEGLSRSTHSKGEHSKGSLIHDNATEIAIIGNLFAHNLYRNPYFKGGVRGVVVNNFVYNPGGMAMHYRLSPPEWEGYAYQTGQMVLVGNVLQHGVDTAGDVPLMVYRGDGDLEFYEIDNLALNRTGFPVSILLERAVDGTLIHSSEKPCWPEGLSPMPSRDVLDYIVQNAGARPWDRDTIDKRIIREVLEGSGRIIDSESEVGGYPDVPTTRQSFNPQEWDLNTMKRK